MTEQELIDKISHYMQTIEKSLCDAPNEDESVIYSALCNCTMQFLGRATNYKQILEITLNGFRQFEAELDKIRTNQVDVTKIIEESEEILGRLKDDYPNE